MAAMRALVADCAIRVSSPRTVVLILLPRRHPTLTRGRDARHLGRQAKPSCKRLTQTRKIRSHLLPRMRLAIIERYRRCGDTIASESPLACSPGWCVIVSVPLRRPP